MFTNWTIPLQIGRVIHGYGFTESRAGTIFTLSALMFSGMTMLVAPALPKYHPKTFPLVGAVATAIGFAVIAMALTSPALVLAGLLLVGAGQGAAFGGAVALSALSAHHTASYSIGTTAATLFGALMLGVMPMLGVDSPIGDPIFLGSAVMMLLCLVLILLPEVPAHPPAATETTSSRGSFGWLMVVPMVSTFLLFAAGQAVWTFAEVLGIHFGYASSAISGALSASALISALAPLLVAWLSNSGNLRMSMSIATLGTGLAALFTCVPVGASSFLIAIGSVAVGQVALQILVFSVCLKADPTGRLSALSSGCMILGVSAGPMLGGILMESGNIALGVTAFAMAIGSWLLAMWFCGQIDKAHAASY
jgi:predicted MFS family arabinose efflux permease